MWSIIDTLYLYLPENYNSQIEIIACYDLDWTLVKPKSGAKFPKNTTDNIIMNNRVNTLKKQIAAGYTIVIFSNQKVTNRESITFKIDRMNHIISLFKNYGLAPIILMAIADDHYRKPEIGMLNELFQFFPNVKAGFYCGDAAGRPGDFSDSDLKFAENAKMNFYTPEKIFG